MYHEDRLPFNSIQPSEESRGEINLAAWEQTDASQVESKVSTRTNQLQLVENSHRFRKNSFRTNWLLLLTKDTILREQFINLFAFFSIKH